MIAQTLFAKRDLRLVHKEIPTVKRNEVLVNLRACGVCRSDIEFYLYGKVGEFKIEEPIVLGHESSGIIVDIGKDVRNLKKGDKVSIDPLMNCGTCDPCSKGLENLCLNKRFLAAPPCTKGCFQEYLVHPAELAIKMNDSISFEEAAMIEPASVAYNAAEQMGAFKGKNKIGIIGAGSIGLILCKILNLNEENEISIFDIDEKRISFASKSIKYVEGFVVGPGTKQYPKDLNIGFDTSGTEKGINMLINMMVPRGCISCIGWGSENKCINFHRIVLNEIIIKGSQIFTHFTFKKVAGLLNKRKINLKDIFRSGYSLEDLENLFLSVNNREVFEPKVILNI